MSKAPLAGHPRRKQIETAIRVGHLSNDEIARVHDVDGGGASGSQLVREHRIHIRRPPELPLEEALAKDPDPAIVPLPDIPDDAEWVYVWLKGAAQMGSDNRWVGNGDVITQEEAGAGVFHGNVAKISATRGLFGLYRANRQRVEDLENLILVNDGDALHQAREQIIVTRNAVEIVPRISVGTEVAT